MKPDRKFPFCLNGKRNNWDIGKRKAIWGLPLWGRQWVDAKARLQELGFFAGTEVIAITGPYAHFRAVIGSGGVFYDDTSAPWGLGPRNDVYPVRFELTNIQEINCDWFDGPRGEHWRMPLDDVYFSMKSVYVLASKGAGNRNVNQSIVFGTGQPLTPPDSFEDDVAKAFSKVGYRIEQLGHKQQFQRVPDGIGMLPKSLALYAKDLKTNPYFVIWDCKFDCGPNGLRAQEERAIKEYIESYAPTRKTDALAGDFWFLIVARNKDVADKIQYGVSQWPWLHESQRFGLLGLRVISLPTLEHLVNSGYKHRQLGGDSDTFLVSSLPSEYAKPYIG